MAVQNSTGIRRVELVPVRRAAPRPTRSRRSRPPTRWCSRRGRSTRACCRCSACAGSRDAVAATPGAGGAGRQPAPAGRPRPPGSTPPTTCRPSLDHGARVDAVLYRRRRGAGGRRRPDPGAGGRARWRRASRAERPGRTIRNSWRRRCRLCCSRHTRAGGLHDSTSWDQRIRADRALVHPGAAGPRGRRGRRAGRGERPDGRQRHDGVPAEARLGRRHAAPTTSSPRPTASRSTATRSRSSR